MNRAELLHKVRETALLMISKCEEPGSARDAFIRILGGAEGRLTRDVELLLTDLVYLCGSLTNEEDAVVVAVRNFFDVIAEPITLSHGDEVAQLDRRRAAWAKLAVAVGALKQKRG